MQLNRILAWVVLACVSVGAGAGVNEWTYAGPAGANVRGVAYVDGNGTALAQSTRRLYRTADHGQSWTEVLATQYTYGTGLLAVNPVNTSQALALFDVVYRSVDGGLTWNPVEGAPVKVPNSVDLTSLAWTRDGSATFIGNSSGTIYRSVDGGATWAVSLEAPELSPRPIYLIDVDAVDPDRIYALSDSTLYESTNGGDSWTSRANPFLFLAASRHEAGVLVGSVPNGTELVISTDYGATLQPLAGPHSTWLAFAPGSADIIYGFNYPTGAWRTTNKGADWETIPLSDVRQFAVSPGNAQQVLAARATGVLASANGGMTWARRSAGMREHVILDFATRNVPGGTGAVYALGYGDRLAFHREANGEWASITSNALDFLGPIGGGSSLAVSPSDGTLYLGQFFGFLRSSDHGANWESLAPSWLGSGGPLMVDPTNPLILLASDSWNNSVRSVDGGANWTQIGADLPVDVAAFAAHDTVAGRVYALASNHSNQSPWPLYVSEDSGASWTHTDWTGDPHFTGYAMAFEPGSENILYIGLDSGLHKTADGGATWSALEPFPEQPTWRAITSIAIDPRAPHIVYVAPFFKLPAKRSVDGGATWEALIPAASEPDLSVEKLVVDPNNSHRIIATTIGAGLYELEITTDLRLSTTSAPQVVGGSGSTVLTITNAGAHAASSVELTATLPESSGGYTVQAGAGLTCERVDVELTCLAPVLRADESTSVTVTFIATQAALGQWSATVTSYEPDATSDDNALSLSVVAAPPPPPSPGVQPESKGGGGGRMDYLLLAGLVLALLPHGRRRFDGVLRRAPR